MNRSRGRVAIVCLAFMTAMVGEGGASAGWWQTNPLPVRRYEHTATLLPSGKVLVTGGLDGSHDVTAQADLFDPATETWTTTAPLAAPMAHHTATLLPSGRVLVVGGARAEVFDPLTETWEETGPLIEPQSGHTATLLGSGKVLVIGGGQPEIYDPATSQWTGLSWEPGQPAPQVLEEHTATLLPSRVLPAGAVEEVLVAGGSSVEIYQHHPATGTWALRLGAPLQSSRSGHTATLLPSGQVLIAGGSGFLDPTAEIYTAAEPTESRLLVGRLTRVRSRHTATLLPSGEILVTGGEVIANVDHPGAPQAEIFDPGTETWRPADDVLGFETVGQTATLLPHGKVLVTGGFDIFSTDAHSAFVLNQAQIYEEPVWDRQTESLPSPLRSGTRILLLTSGRALVLNEYGGTFLFDEDAVDTRWTRIADPQVSRTNFTATLLPSGKVLIAGGHDGVSPTHSAEIFDPADGQWRPTGAMAAARFSHSATLLPSGKVLVAGGFGSGSSVPLAGAEIYDPEADDPATGTKGRWEAVPGLLTARGEQTATLLLSGKVLVAGGFGSGGGLLASTEIYDPETRRWQASGGLNEARVHHTATLLPAGTVQVIGGDPPANESAEIYEPETGVWRSSAPPGVQRGLHTATLLPNGRVLAVGGENHDNYATTNVAIYDPARDAWSYVTPLDLRRRAHGAALLRSGRVLIAGGEGVELALKDNAEILGPPLFTGARQRPQVTAVSPLSYNQPFVLQGTGLRGDSEASSGTTQSSATDVPLLHLRGLDGRRMLWLTARQLDFSATEVTAADFPPGLDPGPYLVTLFAAGVPSEPFLVQAECSLAITQPPVSQTADVGETVTLTVESQGGEGYQWMKNGQVIPGATAASYTTLALTPADSGAVYTVTVRSRCTQTSASATVTVTDRFPPQAAVLSPSGGEYWLLTPADATEPNREVIAWTMSDDIRICHLTVRLRFSQDGGATFQPVPGPVLADEGPGGTCRLGEEPVTTSRTYDVPTDPPGAPGALYEIEVEVTDQALKTTTVRSAHPFFIVQPNPDTVRTVIVSDLPRMAVSAEERQRLERSLQDLANHPRVQGVIVDLANVVRLTELYAAWDGDPADPQKANDVLFAAGGLRDYLGSQIFATFTGARYLVLVGDDRIIPFARLVDGTVLKETSYLAGGDLTNQSTVGAALSRERYLSDDLLAVRSPVRPPFSDKDVATGAFLPDLSIGRLVETPDEISAIIANFISKNGLLDLQALPASTGHKVLVTGYDFLLDSGRKIRGRWREVLHAAPDDSALAPVDGVLLTPDWGRSSPGERITELATHLAGNGGAPYAIVSLNGHATHHQEGVPGEDAQDITGLAAGAIPASLGGSVVYAVGCHGGLTVPDGPSADHPTDLPQTFLKHGALSYLANTGYGWGLVDGVGYGERLVELFTEEMTTGGTVVVGDAVRRAKLRYFLQQSRFDAYDEKTVLQWTFFGLPMMTVRTGISAAASAELLERQGPRPRIRQVAKATLPSFLTQLNAHFDFSAPGVYAKYDAQGDLVSGPGCPPRPDHPGCYYTLNGVSSSGTGAADLPIQPYFVYDSRLSGTSQHGALWMGGSYKEETDWVPVLAQLASNGGDFSSHGALPRTIMPKPTPQYRPVGGGDACRPDDLDLSSLVVVTGEVLQDGEGAARTWRQRLYGTVDLEILYFNDQGQGGNCDREGPLLGAPPLNGRYHQLTGSTVEWAVPASDTAGVWRVVVLYDIGPDAQGQGSWRPLELAVDNGGIWRGTLPLPVSGLLTYFIQAVDRRGNVAWLDFTSADLPASGVPSGLPQPVEIDTPPAPVITAPGPAATFGVGDTIILQGSATDADDGPLPGSALSWTVLLRQGTQTHLLLGPVSGSTVTWTGPAPEDLATAASSLLEIRLTATDSRGQTSTVAQDLQPDLVELTFATEPPGLTLGIDGTATGTPHSVTAWRNQGIDLDARAQTGPGGTTYVFLSWSDGGPEAHTIMTPASPAAYTATFQVSQTAGPLDFFTTSPCRLMDTRGPGGPSGGPALQAGQTRVFALAGRCGVPETAQAVAVNLTVVHPTAVGHLRIYPQGIAGTGTSSINFGPGDVRANNAVLRLGDAGSIVVLAGTSGTVDLVIDVTGYFE